MRILVLIICLVCIFDIYCTVKYSDQLAMMEENLIARVLISVEDRQILTMEEGKSRKIYLERVDVSKLVLFKCLGLLAAADILEWMVRIGTAWSRLIIFFIFFMQIFLFLYLVT